MSKYFSLVYSGEIHKKGGEDQIIPQEEFSTLLTALEVLDQAKQDVAIYLEENKKECQKYLEKAKEAGFNQGLTEFNKHIIHYSQKIKEFSHELQKLVIPLALKAAQKIVGNELTTHPETIVNIIQQHLKSVTQNHHITIYVNKQDRDILEKEKKEIKAILEHVETLKIIEREDISRGDCIIETEAGIINASLENQWRALTTAFETFMKR